jgi:hypothetical protein
VSPQQLGRCSHQEYPGPHQADTGSPAHHQVVDLTQSRKGDLGHRDEYGDEENLVHREDDSDLVEDGNPVHREDDSDHKEDRNPVIYRKDGFDHSEEGNPVRRVDESDHLEETNPVHRKDDFDHPEEGNPVHREDDLYHLGERNHGEKEDDLRSKEDEKLDQQLITGITDGSSLTTNINLRNGSRVEAYVEEVMEEVSVMEKNTEVSVTEKNTEVSVMEKKSEVSVMEKKSEVSEKEKNKEVSVMEKNTEVSVMEKNTEVSVKEKNTEVSVMEKNTEAAEDWAPLKRDGEKQTRADHTSDRNLFMNEDFSKSKILKHRIENLNNASANNLCHLQLTSYLIFLLILNENKFDPISRLTICSQNKNNK